MLQKPCSVLSAPLNSGPDCRAKMGAPYMIIMVPATDTWEDSDEEDFLAYIITKIHDTPSKRWIPLFGGIAGAPIRTINDGKESDVTVTYDDGSVGFIRNGMFTRTLITNEGGLYYAQMLLSFNKFRKYAFIEIDKNQTVLRKRNADGTLSGVKPNVAYAIAPELAGLKTEFQSGFVLNFSVEEYIQKGEIATSDETLTDVIGLINAEVTQAAAATATILKIGVQTIGSNNDLVAEYPQIASLTAFNVVEKDNSAVVTPSAAAIVGGHVELTGVYTSGKTYIVSGTTPAALKALTPSLEGYEITQSVEITIP